MRVDGRDHLLPIRMPRVILASWDSGHRSVCRRVLEPFVRRRGHRPQAWHVRCRAVSDHSQNRGAPGHRHVVLVENPARRIPQRRRAASRVRRCSEQPGHALPVFPPGGELGGSAARSGTLSGCSIEWFSFRASHEPCLSGLQPNPADNSPTWARGGP